MNALAHTAEALYVQGRNDEGDERALAGARLIAELLPRVLEEPDDLELRTHLLEGAAHAGEALALAGLGLGHAMAQAVGGAYGLPHGTMNAIVLPAALRFNAELAPEAVRRFGEAIGAADDPGREGRGARGPLRADPSAGRRRPRSRPPGARRGGCRARREPREPAPGHGRGARSALPLDLVSYKQSSCD